MDRAELPLSQTAARVRQHVVRMSAQGGAFVGAALSVVDVLVYLYARVLRVSAQAPDAPERDRLLLSKGHAVPALYGTLVERGFFEERRLATHLDGSDVVYWHPNPTLPGVEFYSGSLGHLLSVGLGLAYDARLRGSSSRVYVVLGDGELNEGSIWESLLVGNALRLDNLYAVVDRNQLQANVPTEQLVPLEPLAEKLRAFGWSVVEFDGHDFAAMAAAFDPAQAEVGKPKALIARTVRGKGIRSLEARVDGWFAQPDSATAEAWLAELDAAIDGRSEGATP